MMNLVHMSRSDKFFYRSFVSERKKIRWTGLGLVKKDKQLDERICVLFLLNLKNKLVGFILAPYT
jgi:hypothetical protein